MRGEGLLSVQGSSVLTHIVPILQQKMTVYGMSKDKGFGGDTSILAMIAP